MNKTNNTLQALLDIFGLDESMLGGFDDIKITKDGKTVVDIKDGKDQLHKEEPKPEDNFIIFGKPEPKAEPKPVPKTTAVPVVNFKSTPTAPEYKAPNCFVMPTPEPVKEEDDSVEETSEWLSDDTLAVNDDEFIISNKVCHCVLANDQTELTFAHPTEDGWVPGVFEEDLLEILLYRNDENPVRAKMINDLLATYHD